MAIIFADLMRWQKVKDYLPNSREREAEFVPCIGAHFSSLCSKVQPVAATVVQGNSELFFITEEYLYQMTIIMILYSL